MVTKTWYGSHTSGTYGKLGYAVSEGSEATQTLVVPAGCNLTLVNMDILSSVNIVVEDGGTLVLNDSVVQGRANVGGLPRTCTAEALTLVTRAPPCFLCVFDRRRHDRDRLCKSRAIGSRPRPCRATETLE